MCSTVCTRHLASTEKPAIATTKLHCDFPRQVISKFRVVSGTDIGIFQEIDEASRRHERKLRKKLQVISLLIQNKQITSI